MVNSDVKAAPYNWTLLHEWLEGPHPADADAQFLGHHGCSLGVCMMLALRRYFDRYGKLERCRRHLYGLAVTVYEGLLIGASAHLSAANSAIRRSLQTTCGQG
jgi:hypothetical protein